MRGGPFRVKNMPVSLTFWEESGVFVCLFPDRILRVWNHLSDRWELVQTDEPYITIEARDDVTGAVFSSGYPRLFDGDSEVS